MVVLDLLTLAMLCKSSFKLFTHTLCDAMFSLVKYSVILSPDQRVEKNVI